MSEPEYSDAPVFRGDFYTKDVLPPQVFPDGVMHYEICPPNVRGGQWSRLGRLCRRWIPKDPRPTGNDGSDVSSGHDLAVQQEGLAVDRGDVPESPGLASGDGADRTTPGRVHPA